MAALLIASGTTAVAAAGLNSWLHVRRHRRELERSRVQLQVALVYRRTLVPDLIDRLLDRAPHCSEELACVLDALDATERAPAEPTNAADGERELTDRLRQLVALLALDDVLRADEDAQLTLYDLTDCDERIQTARQRYNAAARALNRRVNLSSGIARVTGATRADYFDVGAVLPTTITHPEG